MVYKIGDTPPTTGKEIKEIIAQSNTVLFYKNIEGKNSFHCEISDMDISGAVFNRRDEILSKIPSDLPAAFGQSLFDEVSHAVFHALHKTTVSDALETLDPVDKRMSKIKNQKQLYHHLILSNLAFSAIFLLIFLYFSDSNDVFYCLSSGLIGALFSLLIRSRDLKLNVYDGLFYTTLQSFFIVFVGIISGAFIFYASQGNILFGNVSDNSSALIVISFLSGFSEKYVVSFVKKAERAVDQ